MAKPSRSPVACRTLEFRSYRGSRQVDVSGFKAPECEPPPRGDVLGFSAAARRRLRAAISRIDWGSALAGGICYFGTLTSRPTASGGLKEWRRRMHQFSVEFVREFPSSWFLWRLEIGAEMSHVHYHLVMVFNGSVSGYRALRRRLVDVWLRIAGAVVDRSSRRYSVRLVRIEQPWGVLSYVAKYVSKPEGSGSITAGRVWGFVGRRNVPKPRPAGVVRLQGRRLHVFFRLLRRGHLGQRFNPETQRWYGHPHRPDRCPKSELWLDRARFASYLAAVRRLVPFSTSQPKPAGLPSEPPGEGQSRATGAPDEPYSPRWREGGSESGPHHLALGVPLDCSSSSGAQGGTSGPRPTASCRRFPERDCQTELF